MVLISGNFDEPTLKACVHNVVHTYKSYLKKRFSGPGALIHALTTPHTGHYNALCVVLPSAYREKLQSHYIILLVLC